MHGPAPETATVTLGNTGHHVWCPFEDSDSDTGTSVLATPMGPGQAPVSATATHSDTGNNVPALTMGPNRD